MATKQKIEEQFWDMLEPNNHYLAVSKLDKTYDILNKFNWFNLERLLYDLKKYYPRTWAKFDQITKKKGYDFISNNLKRGVELGVYRKEIHVEILAKILTEKFEIIFNQAVFSSPSISFATIYQELMSHYIYGIVNDSGKEYFEENKEKFMSNETN